MKNLLWISVAFLGILNSLVCAQTSSQTVSKEALPPGPLIITQLPDFAQWTIDFTYPPASKPGQSDPNASVPQQNRLTHVLVTKTKNIIHEERVFEDGMKGELWTNPDIAVARLPNAPGLVAGFGNGLAGNAFPDFDWISKDNYIRVQEHNQVKCLVFQQAQYGIEHSFLGVSTAYIDFKTRYPVGYEMNSATRTYVMLPAPTEQLVIPDEFVAAAKAMSDRVKAATSHLAAP